MVGNNEKIQKVYYRLGNSLHPNLEARKYRKLRLPEAKKRIDSLQQREIASFDKFRLNEEITQDLYDLIKLDRTTYYKSLQGSVAAYKFFRERTKNADGLPEKSTKMWNGVFNDHSLDNPNLLKSIWSYQYLENYLLFKQRTGKVNYKEISEFSNKGLIHTYNIDMSKTHLSGNNLKYHNSTYLMSQSNIKRYEKEFIQLFDEYKNHFPKSEYSKYIEPNISEIVDFHKKAEQNFGNGIKFLKSHETITSIDECLKPFRGEKIYVDIWATWCSPCKAEFSYKKELEFLLIEKNIKMLYISLDDDRNDTQWKNMIKYYELTGNHIRASKELKLELQNLLGKYGIPRYLLVDNKGNIIAKNAKRPSNLKGLENQINENYVW